MFECTYLTTVRLPPNIDEVSTCCLCKCTSLTTIDMWFADQSSLTGVKELPAFNVEPAVHVHKAGAVGRLVPNSSTLGGNFTKVRLVQPIMKLLGSFFTHTSELMSMVVRTLQSQRK